MKWSSETRNWLLKYCKKYGYFYRQRKYGRYIEISLFENISNRFLFKVVLNGQYLGYEVQGNYISDVRLQNFIIGALRELEVMGI